MQSLRPEMNNQPQPNAWPITGPSFILMNQANFRSRRGAAVREFISWIFSTDDSAVEALGYLPLPKTAKSAVFGHWTQFI
jgi:phosphate transport system substrate-binding protein